MKKLKRESKSCVLGIFKLNKNLGMVFLAVFSYAPNLSLLAMQPSDDSPGLETVQISDERTGDQGNWVKKKNWLLKSYEVNANIYRLATQIAQTKKIYQSKYNSIDDEFDKFYKDLGMEQGKIKELFDSISRYLEKKKTKDATSLTTQLPQSSQQEKTVENDQDVKKKIEILEGQIRQMESDLEQLKLDMDAISDVDKSLTQRLQKVDEQITSSMTQAEAAKTKVEVLWDIIDDKKARAIYYEVLNIEANLKAILSYLQDILAGDFDKVVSVAKEKIILVSSNIKKLEEKGLIIKDRSHRVEQIKLEDMKKIELEAAAKKTEEIKPVVKKEPELGIVQKIYAFMVSGAARIYNFFKDLFTGKLFAKSSSRLGESQAKKTDSQSTQLESQQKSSDSVITDSKTALSNSLTNSPTSGVTVPGVPGSGMSGSESSVSGVPEQDLLTMPMP